MTYFVLCADRAGLTYFNYNFEVFADLLKEKFSAVAHESEGQGCFLNWGFIAPSTVL